MNTSCQMPVSRNNLAVTSLNSSSSSLGSTSSAMMVSFLLAGGDFNLLATRTYSCCS